MVPDPDITGLMQLEQDFLTHFEDIAHTGSLVCAINHLAISHTTGQGKLQGFALKVVNIYTQAEIPY